MSRTRKPSPAFVAQIGARMATQMQAAAAVAVASNTAAAIEAVDAVAGDVAAIDVAGINATLTDLQERVDALEAPPP